jgi:hypothetical protein
MKFILIVILFNLDSQVSGGNQSNQNQGNNQNNQDGNNQGGN